MNSRLRHLMCFLFFILFARSTFGAKIAEADLAFIPTGCDINQDGFCDCEDIDDLTEAIANGVDNDLYDLNEDGLVDEFDREELILGEDFFGAQYGDVDFNGQFNFDDLLNVDLGGEYEDDIFGGGLIAFARGDERVSYCDGDWNGDGVFDSADIVFVFENTEFVPEPVSQPWLILMATLCVLQRRGKKR